MAWKVVTVGGKQSNGRIFGLPLDTFGTALEASLQKLEDQEYKIEKIEIHRDAMGQEVNRFFAHIVAHDDSL